MKISVKEKEAKILSVTAKVGELFSASLLDKEKTEIYSYSGYVPGFMPGKHFGDYLMLDIDIDTGQILNWKTPTPNQIEEFIEQEEQN